MVINRNLRALGLTIFIGLSLRGLPLAYKEAIVAQTRLGLLASGQWLFSRVSQYARSEQKTWFLLRKNVELALDNMRLRETSWENIRLRQALEFRQREAAISVIPAEVIGRDPDQLFDTIVINVGRDRGIQLDWPVITAEGLVGHVSQVGTRSSVVQLLMRSPVSAMVQESRAQGIVYWADGNRFQMRFVEASNVIQKGDRVVSSGLGGRYPKGIPIGVLVKVQAPEKDPLFHDLSLDSYVDFLKLEEVFVIEPEKRDGGGQ